MKRRLREAYALFEETVGSREEKTVENFTPVSGLIGGLLIGLSTVLLILLNGRIAGISGIVGGLLARNGSEVGWRAVFIVGLLLGAFIYMLATGGALLVTIPAFRLILKRPRPVLADKFALPTNKDVDARLLWGSALFGIGWGLAGFCPGPAVTALASGLTPVFVFVAAMVVGMALYKWIF